MDFEQFAPPPKLTKNQLKMQHATFKGVDEVELKKMHKPVKHYDEVVDPVEVMKHKAEMASQVPDID